MKVIIKDSDLKIEMEKAYKLTTSKEDAVELVKNKTGASKKSLEEIWNVINRAVMNEVKKWQNN